MHAGTHHLQHNYPSTLTRLHSGSNSDTHLMRIHNVPPFRTTEHHQRERRRREGDEPPERSLGRL